MAGLNPSCQNSISHRQGTIMNPAKPYPAGRQPAGLYIHIPFCLSRCGYCTFPSGVYNSDLADAYLIALENELHVRDYFSSAYLPETIFIGGGTPSCLSLKQLDKLLSLLPQPIVGEATCELNPDSCDREKLQLLLQYGINRVSFGVQTFNNQGLRLLQRRHSAETARKAVSLAVHMGFSSVNVDIIHGWPGQTDELLLDDLINIVDLEVQHISSYTLIVDADACCYDQYRALLGGDEVDGDRGRRYWEKIENFLENKGFRHYETSNFCRDGYQCLHNVATWRGGEYLGIGLGACSHIEGERFGNTTDINTYIQCSNVKDAVVAYREKLEGEEKARECAVFWLRLFDGVELDAFFTQTGFDFCTLYNDVLPGLLREGILEMGKGRVWVARRYQPVLDSVLEQLI